MYNLNLTQHNQYRVLKPDGGRMLNWANPLTQRLGFYVNFAECGMTNGSNASLVFEQISRSTKFPSSNTLVTSVAGNLGVALNFTGGANSLIAWNVDTAPSQLSIFRQLISTVNNPLTIAVKFRTTTTPGAEVQMAGLTSASTDKWMITVTTSGTIGFKTLDLNVAVTTGTYVDGNWYTVFGTHQPGVNENLAIYDAFGIQKEPATIGAGVGDISTGATSNFGIGANAFNTNNFTGQIEWVGVWANRILSAAEMQQMAANPYQIFNAPAFKRIWLDTTLPVVGGRTTKNTRGFTLGQDIGQGWRIPLN